jgi:hypothetical protein
MDTITKFLKTNKSLVSLGVLAVIAFLAWSNREKIKKMLGIGTPTGSDKDATKETEPTKETAPTAATGGGTSAGSGLNNDLVIKMGSSGAEVKELQKMLNAEMTLRKSIPITEAYPINTAANDVALSTDGEAGDKTIGRLFKYAEVRETTLNKLRMNSKMFTSPTSPYNTNQAIKDAVNRQFGSFSIFSK